MSTIAPIVLTTTASALIEDNSTLYGKDVVRSKFPNAVDGLTLVHRRSIWATKGDGNNKPSVKKSLKIVSEITTIHPHGDQSVYDTIVRMSRHFEYRPPLFTSHSDNGTYGGDRGASKRYTEMALSEFTYDVFLRGIDFTALHKTLTEDLSDYEPINLVPSIPTALLFGTDAIGYGFGSLTAPRNLGNVCDITIAFINHIKNNPTASFDCTKYVDKLVPDFPIRNTITNYEQIIAGYKSGDFNTRVCMDGDVELSDGTIRIFTIPYGNSFENVEKKLQELCTKNHPSYNAALDKCVIGIRNSEGDSKEVGEIVIKLKRTANVFEVWELVKRAISFSGSMVTRPNYTDGEYIVNLSPTNIMRLWYFARYNIIVSSKKYTLTRLTHNLRIVEAYLIVCDHTDDVISIIRNNNMADGTCQLMSKYNLTPAQAEYLCKAPISILSNTSRAEQQTKFDNLTKDIADLKHSFSTIADEMAEEVLRIKKKYQEPRVTTIPNYIGYVKINDDCIQFQDTKEICGIIDSFQKNAATEIHMYDGPHLYKVNSNGKLERAYIPKYTAGDIYGLRGNAANTVTVNISGGTASCVKGFVPGLRSAGYFYTTVMSKVIHRNGAIESVDITEVISFRKTICRGASTDIIYVYPDIKQDHYVIVLNTTEPNVITLQRIGADKTKLLVSPVGEVEFVHSYDKSDIFVNIPDRFLNRNATRVVNIVDAEKLLDGKSFVKIDIGATKYRTHKYLKLI